ncbi:MAG: DUF3667 domain-containing protein [Ferruginibacter sp.]
MKYNVSDVKAPVHIHTCRNCKHSFTGKICNNCGEKVFNEKHLTAKHFFHQVIDFFWHWENKVLKTIKLNTFKPGFVTRENLNGVTVPYAKPVQLYLVMSVLFFLGVGKIGSTDYIPNLFDYQYYSISDYKIFKWAKPADEAVENSMLNLIRAKQKAITTHLAEDFAHNGALDSAGGMWLRSKTVNDSFYINRQQLQVYANNLGSRLFNEKFESHIATYGKSLIFFILPLIAAFFFLLFFKKIRFYGAALILSVHFMVYNMLMYLVTSAIFYLPYKWFGSKAGGYLMAPFDWVFYNKFTEPVSTFVFGYSFEFMHLVFWMPWFFVAFKRLFNTVWWKNLLISWLCSRVFFYFIFGVLKKGLIAFTVWSMH